MRFGFETLGNATLVISEDNRPVLATDPWLEGRCYSGSWALERKLTGRERQAVFDADYIWISHGHPDHFHIQGFIRISPPSLPSFAEVRAYRLSLNYGVSGCVISSAIPWAIFPGMRSRVLRGL